MAGNRNQLGVRKDAGGLNPNLTETPYVAGGIEGSVQYKGANNALDGDSNLLWNKITRLFSVLGSLFVKSNSSVSGNALEIRNSTNSNLRTITNKGEETKYIVNQALPLQANNAGITNVIQYDIANLQAKVNGESLTLIATGSGGDPSFAVARRTELHIPDGGGNYHNVASWNEVTGNGNASAGYFSNCVSIGLLPVYYSSNVNDPRGYVGFKATGEQTGVDINYSHSFGGMRSLLRLRRGDFPNQPSENMLTVGDGSQILFELFIDRKINNPNTGANDTMTNDFLGVRVRETTQFLPTTEMFFKTTQSGLSVEPLVLSGRDIKMGFANGKQGFYGKEPIAKQNLPANPTNTELATVLSNLGLITII